MTLDTSTQIGADGLRVTAGSQPTDPAPYRRVSVDSVTSLVNSRKLSANAAAASAGNALAVIVGEAPYAGNVTSVTYTPVADITGAATNYRTFSLVNKGTDGNGSTVVATLAFSSSGVTASDFDEKTIPVTNGNKHVAAGDILVWSESVTGTGLASPGGLVQVELAK